MVMLARHGLCRDEEGPVSHSPSLLHPTSASREFVDESLQISCGA
jgi:hypothetical protein